MTTPLARVRPAFLLARRYITANRLYYATAATLIVGVLWQSHTVVARNTALSTALDRALRVQVAEGDAVLALTGVDLDGRRIRVDIRGQERPALVVGFSINCPYCQQSIDAWSRIATVASQVGVKVYIVAAEDPAAVQTFAKSRPLFGEVVAEPAYSTHVQMRMGTVPSTVVVVPGGFVRKVWIGAVNSKFETEIETYLKSLGT